jgi:gluconolactonase
MSVRDGGADLIARRKFLQAGLAAGAALVSAPSVRADELPLGLLPGTRFPDPRIEVLDRRFNKYRIENAGIIRLATGFGWCEGPVYFGDGGYLLFSDIPNSRIMQWSENDGHVGVFRYRTNYSNGNTRDREGRLISCEHDTRRVTRTEFDGSITVLIDRFEGKPLNAPNDVVVSSDGAVWFTDPFFGNQTTYEGHLVQFELPPQVYRLDPKSGRATAVATGLGGPNGIVFSPDEKKLYIIDGGVMSAIGRDSNIRLFDVSGEHLINDRIFVPNFGASTRTDGMRTDIDGNVWCAAGHGDPREDGVRCYAPNGDLIGKIHLPESCANLCFGGKKKNRLFIAASTSIYAVYVNTAGAQVP